MNRHGFFIGGIDDRDSDNFSEGGANVHMQDCSSSGTTIGTIGAIGGERVSLMMMNDNNNNSNNNNNNNNNDNNNNNNNNGHSGGRDPWDPQFSYYAVWGRSGAGEKETQTQVLWEKLIPKCIEKRP